MPEFVDVIVPRGGKDLISRLMRESRIPMIKHLDGVCHVYIDDSADPEMALRIADNAKTQRYGTCNTMETLLVAEGIAREVVRYIQDARKNAGFAISDRINVVIDGVDNDPLLTATIATWHDYMCTETLAEQLVLGKGLPGAHSETLELDDKTLTIAVSKAE